MKKVTRGALADTRLGMLDAADTLRTREDFTNAISRLWDRVAESYVQIGRYLIQAKADLPHGEFEAMIARDLPFDASVGRKLRAAAELVDSGVLPRDALPQAWSIVAELATLAPAEQQRALTDGVIHPDMRREDLRAFKREIREAAPVAPAAPPVPVLPVPEPSASSVPRLGLEALFAGVQPDPSPLPVPAPTPTAAPTPPTIDIEAVHVEAGLSVGADAADQPDGVELPPPLVTVRPPPALDVADAMERPWLADDQDPGVVLVNLGPAGRPTLIVVDPDRFTIEDDAVASAIAEHIVRLHNASLSRG